MTPSQQALDALASRHVFRHAIWMEDALVTAPCSLLLVHPEVPATGSEDPVFGFYALDEEDLQQAMQVCVGQVMGCTFVESGMQQCRVEIVEQQQSRWFRHDGTKFKRCESKV